MNKKKHGLNGTTVKLHNVTTLCAPDTFIRLLPAGLFLQMHPLTREGKFYRTCGCECSLLTSCSKLQMLAVKTLVDRL